MGSVVDIPWIGGQNVMGRVSKYMGRGGLIYHG